MNAYLIGYSDFESGKSYKENPYLFDSDEYEDLEDGWNDAFDDDCIYTEENDNERT